jgi:uncharacterized protein YdeI (YjbR/CyaY-like superfamily)
VAELVFFKTQAHWRKWLTSHHGKIKELWVGFYKKGTGRPSITYQEALDEALCFGWIDGVRKSVDSDSYTIRFTPRNSKSIWSAVNIKRVRELEKLRLMQPPGLAAFQARADEKSAVYSYEQRRNPKLDAAHEKKLKANIKAWVFFQAQPPSYRRIATWWIVSAKREETRLKRLETLIEDSAHGRMLAALTQWSKSK